MPQMAPINWLSLYFLFTLIFMMFMIMNFYMFIYKPKLKMYNPNKKNINWKW
uniref:ATP synthase complex subunit 8 n=1 Tax=Pachyrhinus yasumatsui TaxID=2071596 RepID=A0A343SB11_9CUCU|nr:ATP synthase F0 subunit 8 [Pachyrhinus yasumatsui]